MFAVLALLSVVGSSYGAAVSQDRKPARILLDRGQASLEVDSDTGVITGIRDRASGIILAAPAGMAESFRLILLKPDKTQVTILGKDQKLASSKQDANKLSLYWDGPLHDTTGTDHDIAVRMDVAAAGSSLEFTLHFKNGTAFKVQEAWYPLVGGLTQFGPPGQPSDATLWVPTSTPSEKPLKLPVKAATFGYPGYHQMTMSFACLQSKSAGRSLYFASHDPVTRYRTYHFTELAGPEGKKDLFACIQHHPFTPPGGTFDGSPVVLRFVDGDWRACGQVYREWFKATFGICQPSQCWIRRESFYVMTMFLLPEGTINYRFKDIPRWAKAAKDHGINSIQISGWHMGGHDNGYPHYTIDPRLGTWEELEEGIRECHKMGMRVYFFVNYQQMTIDTDWYKNELHKYREMAADGGYTWTVGWGMGTLWARMGHPRLMIWADPAFPQYRKIIVSQFAKLAQIGADGVHVDKMVAADIDYNPDVPMSPDTATWEGAILLTREIMAECRKYSPDWAMSFECTCDRLLEFTGSTWWVGNQLITRQVFPENVESIGVNHAYDYLGVNNAVRDGHAVMVAPLGYSRGLDWAPFADLADYIKEVKRIRDSLQETVFHGEALGASGVKLQGAPESGIQYNVFRNRDSGRRVCIVTNNHMTAGKLTILGFEGGSGGTAIIQVPFQPAQQVDLPATVEIPAERLAFVEEAGGPTRATTVSPPITSLPSTTPTSANPANGGFESGDFTGWTADPNWVVADDSRVYYSGWKGKHWAWSGGKGEPPTGVLKSNPFILDNDAVRLLISGWSSVQGTGRPRKWNYVTLNLEDGTELDRVWAPNLTAFVPVYLDGSGHKGEKVFVKAFDDADQATYSMMCIDDVCTASLPADLKQPVPVLPPFDAEKSIKLEDESCLLEFSRANGSLTRVRDKKGGLELILEPRLADSFKFALPIPGKESWQTIEANWIVGREQKLSSYENQDGKLVLDWRGPLKNYLGEPFGASVTETIELVHGGVLFNLSIENPTACPVGETNFPLIGGIQGLGQTRGQLKATDLVRPGAGDTCIATDIFRVFNNMSWLGDQGPEQFFHCPKGQPEPWVALNCPKIGRSVCVGAHDPSDRNLVIRLELLPDNSGTTREDGNWPRLDELHGQPAGVELSFVDVANSPAGRTYQATPVFLQFSGGDGRKMREVYAEWKARGQATP